VNEVPSVLTEDLCRVFDICHSMELRKNTCIGFALLIVFSVILSPLHTKRRRCQGSNPTGIVKPSSYLLF